ncbi:MAG: prolipoprotein diacylglyceryl transferase [Proteobacteria bacterium]|nr:prolipoprotein diacylglyceryl transferase [Pseudomonadota bacterium]
MTFVIPYPSIDPILFQLGPLIIRWYALAYIGGLLLGWWYMRALAAQSPVAAERDEVDDFLVWATLGVVFGGRLGYVLFYNPGFYLDNPSLIFAVWRGGMSFHGGLLGVAAAAALFAHRRGIRLLPFADLLACIAPIGLFLGRLANFINGELYGRISEAPWAMVFPRGGPNPRHPSQLYEAGMEGAVLFVVLFFLRRREAVRRRAGLLTGVFLAGYGVARTIAELFRQPDIHLGFLSGGTTMGQWLSAPMLAAGVYLMVRARRET